MQFTKIFAIITSQTRGINMKANNKRTSGRYKLLFLNLENNRRIQIQCNFMTGEIIPCSLAGNDSGLDLPVLDHYILEHFTDEEQLRSKLRKLGYYIPANFEPRIVYRSNGEEKFLRLVYQNSELCELAVLCKNYKEKYNDYAARKGLSSRELRKLISHEIGKEHIWKDFYWQLLRDIHVPDFFDFLQEGTILDDRVCGYMKDYLDNEDQSSQERRRAFASAQYYLKDTFTAYKPIRGMIVCQLEYQQLLFDEYHRSVQSGSPQTRDQEKKEILGSSVQYQTYDNGRQISIDGMLCDNFGGLSVSRIPWYERTARHLNEMEVAYLEKHDTFDRLSDDAKIAFVNSLLVKEASSSSTGSWQKRKV